MKKYYKITSSFTKLSQNSVLLSVGVLECISVNPLTLFRMGIFGAANGSGVQKGHPLPKICHTYPTMMKLGTFIPYLKKI